MANQTNSAAGFPISPQSNQMQPNSSQSDNRHSIGIPVLSEEEKAVMRECERDSFYKRALRASFGSALAAHMLVRGGYWSGHVKYGSLPKVVIFSTLGFFGGKLYYVPALQQKILEKIPNSDLAAAVRKSKGLSQSDDAASLLEGTDTGAHSARSRDEYSAPEGLDDRFRPSIDRIVKEAEKSTEKGSLSYEELRRRNRQQCGDHSSKLPARSPDQLPESKSDGSENRSESSSPPAPPPQRRRTNMWGDPID